jgi:hypothetical protein
MRGPSKVSDDALTVVQDVCAVGVGIPAAVVPGINSNRTMQEMLALANEMAHRIAWDTRDWQFFRSAVTYSGNGTTTDFLLPADYKRMLLSTNVWRSTSTLAPMRFIPDSDAWLQRRLHGYADPRGEWTIIGNRIRLRRSDRPAAHHPRSGQLGYATLYPIGALARDAIGLPMVMLDQSHVTGLGDVRSKPHRESRLLGSGCRSQPAALGVHDLVQHRRQGARHGGQHVVGVSDPPPDAGVGHVCGQSCDQSRILAAGPGDHDNAGDGDFSLSHKNCIALARTGGASLGDTFQNDNDVFGLDERVLKLGMIYQWKAQKGSPYAEDLGSYNDALDRIAGADSPAPIIVGRRPISAAYNASYPFPIDPGMVPL